MSDIQIATVLDYTVFRLDRKIIELKRNPKSTQTEIFTLQAVLQLYEENKININWIKGEPYMSLPEDSEMTTDSLKSEFESLINGVSN